MKSKNKLRKDKGITLIALIITIIVILILAGISIAMLAGNNSILNRAGQSRVANALGTGKDAVNMAVMSAVQDYYQSVYDGQNVSNTYSATDLDNYIIANVRNGNTENKDYNLEVADVNFGVWEGKSITLTYTPDSSEVTGTLDNGVMTWGSITNKGQQASNPALQDALSTKSYVGYYAEIDGIYGIIYADLLAQTQRSGNWGSNGSWSITSASTSASDYKTYNVRELTESDTTFGTYNETGVVTVNGTTGNNRFYVMEISDRSNGVNWETACGTTAGTNGRWVLPSKEKWSMFGGMLGITSGSQRTTFGLNKFYWASDSYPNFTSWGPGAWYANFEDPNVFGTGRSDSCDVRLTTTY